jgi:uncharacterized protein GlcG (DUF336 family)
MRWSWVMLAAALLLGSGASADPIAAPSTQFSVDLGGDAVDACNAAGEGVAVVVVDAAGAPISETEGAGAPDTGEDRATRKARTAALFRTSSASVAVRAKSDPAIAARLKGDATFLAEAGGLPILRDGVLIGAIGVAGASTPARDESCAAAGLAKMAGRAD